MNPNIIKLISGGKLWLNMKSVGRSMKFATVSKSIIGTTYRTMKFPPRR